MCLCREDVTGIVGDAVKPLYKILDGLTSSIDDLKELAIKQTKTEGQILNLQEKSKDREKFEDELFDRVRSIETMTEPRSSCSAIFTNLEKGADSTVRLLAALDKQMKDRTWAILILFAGAFLSVMGSLTVGLAIYFAKSGA